jgi:DMSO/TMAO reductase YedYZ molybdopterin-dependent catalytic subunit
MIVSVIVGGAPTPITAVGSRVIDATPGAVKDWAIRNLGENDKPFLLAGIYTALAVLAAVTGLIAWRSRRLALAMATLLGLIGFASAAADRTSLVNPASKLAPAMSAILASVGFLYAFSRSLSPSTGAEVATGDADEETLLAVGAGPSQAAAPTVNPTRGSSDFLNSPTLRPKSAARGTAGLGSDTVDANPAPYGFDRRAFLIAVMASSSVAAVGFSTSRSFGDVGARSRNSITLPAAADGVSPLQQGMRLDGIRGITPYVTANDDFYRVDTALSVPQIDASQWRLKIHGMVDDEFELSFAELLDMPLVERRITIACVSNEVGGRYAGNATWLGVRLSDILARAGIDPDADAVKSTSVDGMTIGTPLQALTDDREALLAIAMNGEPLPLEHGFPVRMVVPGLYGYVSATKWLVDLEVTRFDDFSAYWTDRGFDSEAPIKTFSRIDVPTSFAKLDAGPNAVAGVAWAQNVGIAKVEVSLDGVDWQETRLADEDTIQTWRQWVYEWDAEPGSCTIAVRATDSNGDTQTSRRVPPRPNGATGWHSVSVSVA